MTKDDLSDAIERAAENSSLKLISRIAMVIGSLIIIPLGAYIGVRSVNAIDKMQDSIIAMNGKMTLLTVKVDQLGLDTYGANDAKRDFQLRDYRIQANKELIDRLERELNELKKGQTK